MADEYSELFEKVRRKLKRERLTLSLPAYLVDYCKKKAELENTTVSSVVEIALRVMINNQTNSEMMAALLEE